LVDSKLNEYFFFGKTEITGVHTGAHYPCVLVRFQNFSQKKTRKQIVKNIGLLHKRRAPAALTTRPKVCLGYGSFIATM